MTEYLLSIDQGTSSSRAIIFNRCGAIVAQHQLAFKQYYPQDGWVEHDPEEIWQSVLVCCHQALKKAALMASDVTAIGISNQRETTVIWHKQTGEALYPAIVWQDRRTADACATLASDSGVGELVQEKTGLVIDPYFCASKLQWLLNNVDAVKQAVDSGNALFGTIDSYLLWRLTAGKEHATDATNASRTLLFNIKTQQWDTELLNLFSVPAEILPTVKDSNARFGETESSLFGSSIPITAMIGDQQAAMVGQRCFTAGDMKATYGTGCFLMLNTGKEYVRSQQRLLSTVAYRIDGEVRYALEGSIFVAGAAVQWLRDMLHLIEEVGDAEQLAASVENTGGVYMVPAFTGLGAPYWDPLARGAIVGLTRNTQIADIVRASLECVCYQTNDLLSAIKQDYGQEITTLRVDGGMAQNGWLLQFLSDILQRSIVRSSCVEASALGAAFVAGLGAGMYNSLQEFTVPQQLLSNYSALMPSEDRSLLCQGWQAAVRQVIDKGSRSV